MGEADGELAITKRSSTVQLPCELVRLVGGCSHVASFPGFFFQYQSKKRSNIDRKFDRFRRIDATARRRCCQPTQASQKKLLTNR